MSQLWAPLISQLPKLTPVAVLDVLLVAALIYQVITIVRGRRAAQSLLGVGILLLVYVASGWLGLDLLRTILTVIAPYLPIALIVIFQSELRRFLSRLGRRQWATLGSRLKKREFVDEIMLALRPLSETRTGALIVLERDQGLRTFIESGIALDANISRDLLLAIFQHNGAMHDGAAIVQADRVAAAGCFLPLTMNPNVMRKYGTRHRAAIGISEETDCLTIVVSEETGQISVATHGELHPCRFEQVEDRILAHFGGTKSSRGAASPAAGGETPAPGGHKWQQVKES